MNSVNKITLLGSTYSSYTLVIRLALDYYKISYEMISIMPHSKKTKQYNAIGKIPILLTPDRSEPMIESQVIAKYLDYLHSNTNNNDVPSLTPNDIERQLDMTLWISLINDALSNSVKGFFLPIVILRLNKKATEEEIQQLLSTKYAPQVQNLRRLLAILDQTLLKQQQKYKSSSSPYLLGHTSPTWADFYLYTVFYGIIGLKHGLENDAPLIYNWYQQFEQLDLVRNIRRPADGSLSSRL
ncbi:hypothetical protein BJ944DRAFT_267142 [Cunninghamella echinulata]|nr:hypothetical protein BJ944DRAFT_267142 [Cunninghamella echinulata]